MKKIFQRFFLLLFLFVFVCAKVVSADSGWGGSYDSGSSSDFSSSSSSSFDSGSSSDLSVTEIIILFVIIFIVVELYNKYSGQLSKKVVPKKSYDIERIKEILPDFDVNEFQNQSYEIYKKIQIAWMDFDFKTLRKYTTDELYHSYQAQLTILKAKKQKNVMKNFDLQNFAVLDMEHDEIHISLKVHMLVECNDYVVDQKDKVVRGTSSRKVVYDYEMTFTKSLEKKENKCPNCNAPLDNQQSNVCSYCDSPIISEHYDWVLSKKEVKRQM